MHTGISKSYDREVWRHLYRAALFEVQPGKIAERIGEAELALTLRARELFGASGDHIEEQQDLDDAKYALRALRGALACRTRHEPGVEES